MQPTKATQSITASPTLPPFARRTATLCAVLLSGSVSAAGGSCSNATDLADDACGATVRADLFLARAVCADVPGANAREACRTTANRVAAGRTAASNAPRRSRRARGCARSSATGLTIRRFALQIL